ncbi:hypothetical protein [Mycolicibacterium mageritense]|uniref:hypothetical protein n=1 Tax=Mycolicibacterium mageritense TaxID=53462 RepID=UPI001E56EB6F|nr:hypothetical protein [Mycolicibacterium mageritense]GJJ17822.1 hypothetical protein MTY414_14950 [Mycolicibacterium mageritense]
MANELEVDSVGLRIAAADSEFATSALLGVESGGASGSRPSSAGVAAVNAALTAVQARHSQRVTGQAGDMSVSSARYDTTDDDGGEAITTVSV